MCCKLVHVSRVIKDSKICPLICVSFPAITSVCLMQQSSSKVLVFKRSHWLCGCLWWSRSWSWMEEDGKEENYSNICIYVPLWSNTQNQLQNCILDSLSHFQTGALDCDIIRFRPSINKKFDKYRKSCSKQDLLFFLNKEPADMKTEEATGLHLISLFFLLYRYKRGEEIFILRIYKLKTKKRYAIKWIWSSLDSTYKMLYG